eukprot:TRINITY_DN8825_c0_g1_i1.p1 TRINITY_DN8825_c0_g1~~TRINITY_DN8825_c0_g1_i1.p1  ORF type:complete len:230 (+),score=30.99 TRINITY_DN8825_c0_g1_i1:120-809(+)
MMQSHTYQNEVYYLIPSRNHETKTMESSDKKQKRWSLDEAEVLLEIIGRFGPEQPLKWNLIAGELQSRIRRPTQIFSAKNCKGKFKEMRRCMHKPFMKKLLSRSSPALIQGSTESESNSQRDSVEVWSNPLKCSPWDTLRFSTIDPDPPRLPPKDIQRCSKDEPAIAMLRYAPNVRGKNNVIIRPQSMDWLQYAHTECQKVPSPESIPQKDVPVRLVVPVPKKPTLPTY